MGTEMSRGRSTGCEQPAGCLFHRRETVAATPTTPASSAKKKDGHRTIVKGSTIGAGLCPKPEARGLETDERHHRL